MTERNTAREGSERYRVAVVCSHPIQYLAPWFRHLAADGRIDLTVLYGDAHGLRAGFDPGFGRDVRWDVDLASGYRWQLLPNRAPRPGVGHFFGIVSPGLLTALRPDRFDAVVIQGWNYALYAMALAAARRRGLPVLMRCESVRSVGAAGHDPPFGRADVKRELVRRYLGLCAGGLAVSTGNRRLLLHYGMPPERIFSSPYAVDGQRFALPPAEAAAARAAWRRRLGVAVETPLLLFVGKLQPVKCPELLLEAFLALRAAGVAAHLCLCGDGELRAQLSDRAAAASGAVSFPGFVNQQELPALYAAADALILPSERETFGIVVAEAMHAGLPVVVSDGVGCHEDLVVAGPDGKPTGLCFPVGDGEALLGCLRELCAGPAAPARRQALAAAGLRRIAGWTYAESTAGLVAALRVVVPRSGPQFA